MVRNYWKAKSWLLVLALSFLILSPAGAQESLSFFFVKITDASKTVKNGGQTETQKLVTKMASDFERVENKDSEVGKIVSEVGKIVKEKLALSGDITEAKLTEISSALLAFEKEQNPVDLDAEKEKLVNRLSPRFETLEQAIASKDLEKVREAFKKMNSTWTINESVVRDNSTAHYGRVETAISFLPSSMETEPTDESGT
ncbi:TPA: iron permease [Streptococcus pneumoniae]|nr:iron permease [Streptococcus pneumoniae]HEU9434757.1 iron permease [Streptococcus pneumoniae]HEX0806450.1 iron permease [Streptococcus pneumoniae]